MKDFGGAGLLMMNACLSDTSFSSRGRGSSAADGADAPATPFPSDRRGEVPCRFCGVLESVCKRGDRGVVGKMYRGGAVGRAGVPGVVRQ